MHHAAHAAPPPIPQDVIDRANGTDIVALAARYGAPFGDRDNPERGVPCPGCGGDDRFSCSREKNLFFCRASGVGGGPIKLVQHVSGVGFRRAVESLTGEGALPQPDPAAKARTEAMNNEYRQKAIRAAWRIWRQARPCGPIVRGYMDRRGIAIPAAGILALREIDQHPYWEWSKDQGAFRIIGRAPAMIAAITDGAGALIGVHQTWIDLSSASGKAEIADPETGEICDAKKVRGSQRGGRVVLRGPRVPDEPSPFSRLGTGEGIETVLSWDQCRNEPWTALWAALNLDNLTGRATEKVRHPSMVRVDALGRRRRVTCGGPEPDMGDADCLAIPAGTFRSVTFIADGDSDAFTTECAMARGVRRFKAGDPQARTATDWPPPGADWNDVLRQNGAVR